MQNDICVKVNEKENKISTLYVNAFVWNYYNYVKVLLWFHGVCIFVGKKVFDGLF